MLHYVPLHFVESELTFGRKARHYPHGRYEYATAFFRELAHIASYEVLHLAAHEASRGTAPSVGVLLRKVKRSRFPTEVEFDALLARFLREEPLGSILSA